MPLPRVTALEHRHNWPLMAELGWSAVDWMPSSYPFSEFVPSTEHSALRTTRDLLFVCHGFRIFVVQKPDRNFASNWRSEFSTSQITPRVRHLAKSA